MTIADFNEISVSPPVPVAQWIGSAEEGHLRLLDQTRLPVEVTYLDCDSPQLVWEAILRLVVRGAPAIGVAAGYGMVVSLQAAAELSGEAFMSAARQAAEYLNSSRPTAVNLSWATARVLEALADAGEIDGVTGLEIALNEAIAIHTEDEELCLSIGRAAAPLIAECGDTPRLLTHCNAGALATGGIGTATAGMYVAAAAGLELKVYCDETRPLLQGSRLTAWELQQAEINAVVITDNMAAHVMKEGKVDMVIVGSDRIAANGDAANKIGTYGVAILAKHHHIPFYVAAPYSTFDMSLATGDEIPIELRGSEEITHGFGRRTAPENIETYSPAFDVTPHEMIAGIITDRGVISPVNAQTVKAIIEG